MYRATEHRSDEVDESENVISGLLSVLRIVQVSRHQTTHVKRHASDQKYCFGFVYRPIDFQLGAISK